MSALVTASQGNGRVALPGESAGNQLLALQAQQLADLTASVAAQGEHRIWSLLNAPSLRIRAGNSCGVF